MKYVLHINSMVSNRQKNLPLVINHGGDSGTTRAKMKDPTG